MSGPTRELVLRMAREAGLEGYPDELERFAALAYAAGRAAVPEGFTEVTTCGGGVSSDDDGDPPPSMSDIAKLEARNRRYMIDTLVGDPLTGRKAADICEREGYDVTGVVMTRVAKEGDGFTGVQRCIVNLGAVRWFFDSGAWQRIMFPENQPDRVTEAVAAEREACAKVCEQRAYDRFNECGTREQDTGATYYRGAAAEELEARDEEDHDFAAAIRARGAA